MSFYWRGVFRSYGQRVRVLAQQPQRVALVVVHLATLVVCVVLAVSQVGFGPVRTMVAIVLGVVALFALTTPGGGAGMVFVVSTGLGYLLLSMFEGALADGLRPPPTWQVLLLAAGLFGSHQVDALRGVLPADAAGDPQVLIRWIIRGVEALVPGLVLGALILGVPTSDRGGLFWLVGGLAVLLAIGVPALSVNPRPWRAGRRR